MTASNNPGAMFELFNEIGIIHQLSVAEFNRRIPENLHVSHFAVLNHLVRLGDGRTPKEITSAFQVTKGTMTNTLKDLSERGFIKLKPHATDGRSKVVFLTKSGRAFQKNAIEKLGPALVQLLSKIDTKAVLDCLPALKHLRETLDNNRDNW